jgi:hypothetical protein
MTRKFSSFLNEAARKSLSRVQSKFANSNVGIITAHRGNYDDKPAEEHAAHNNVQNGYLAKDIRAHGFGFQHIRGRFIEKHGTPAAHPVDEHSFLVSHPNANKLKHFLTKHGEKYGQDSVLFKHKDSEHAHLIGTKEGAFPGKGVEHSVGKFHANRFPEFHSLLHRGGDAKPGKTASTKKGFAFEDYENFGVYMPISWFSRREELY